MEGASTWLLLRRDSTESLAEAIEGVVRAPLLAGLHFDAVCMVPEAGELRVERFEPEQEVAHGARLLPEALARHQQRNPRRIRHHLHRENATLELRRRNLLHLAVYQARERLAR